MSSSTEVGETECFTDKEYFDSLFVLYQWLVCGLTYAWHYLSIFGYPILIATGILEHIITIIIMLKLKNWNSTCRVYYFMMAVSDLIYLLTYPL